MKSPILRVRNGLILLVTTLLLGATPVMAGQLQEFEPDFYTTTLIGVDIEVAGPQYAISHVELQHYPGGEGEIIQIDSETLLASLEISFFDDTDTPQESIDIYLGSLETAADEFEVIDRGIHGDHHYALALLMYDNTDLAYFIQVEEDVDGNTDLLEAILTTPDTFEGDLSAAQEEVSVDGGSFMESIEPGTLQEALSTGSSLPASEEATPVTPADTIEFTQSEAYVSIGPDFAFVGEPEVRQTIEYVQFQGMNTTSVVAIGQTGAETEDVLTSFSAGIVSVYAETEVVGEETDNDSAWRLLWVPRDDPDGTYVLILVDMALMPGFEVMQAHELSAGTAAGSLATIQDQVTINGQELMPALDIEQLASVINDHGSGEEVGPTSVPVDDDGMADDQAGDPRDGARLPEEVGAPDTDDDSLGNTSETGGTIDGSPEPGADPTEEPTAEPTEGAGTLTDTSWQGGVHGHLIEWDPSIWFVDAGYPGDLVSDEVNQEDTVVLQSSSGDAETWLFISVYAESENTAGDFLDYWMSDEFLNEMALEYGTVDVLDARTRGDGAGVVLLYTSELNSEFIIVRQAVTLEDGSMLIVTLDAPADDAVEEYGLAVDVSIDGDPVLSVFSNSQIERSVGD